MNRIFSLRRDDERDTPADGPAQRRGAPFSDASESHLLFNRIYRTSLYSPGVMPVRRRKYFEKNEGLAKCISSAICAAGLSVWRSSIFIRV